jgi:CRISPR type IV-associated protein Csf2
MPADLHPYAIEIEPFKLSTKTLMAPRDDFENIPKHLVVENLQEAYTDHQVTKAAQRAASKDGATTKDDLNGFSLNEAMVPGVPLSFNLLLKDATPAQLGLVLQALLSWCNNEALGGGRARGYGSFNPTQLTLQTKKGERIPLFTGNQPFVEFANPDAVAPYLEAMQEALPESVNPAILSQVFPTTVESKAGAAKESSSKGKK